MEVTLAVAAMCSSKWVTILVTVNYSSPAENRCNATPSFRVWTRIQSCCEKPCRVLNEALLKWFGRHFVQLSTMNVSYQHVAYLRNIPPPYLVLLLLNTHKWVTLLNYVTGSLQALYFSLWKKTHSPGCYLKNSVKHQLCINLHPEIIPKPMTIRSFLNNIC